MAILENAIDQLNRAEAIIEDAIGQLRAEEVPKTDQPRGMARTLRRVAILGAGTMGARVAAHFANAGVPSLLLSRPNTKDANRNATALKGIDNAFKQRPGAFFNEEGKRLVKAGNFEDNLNDLAECDWIVETVAEDLQIKRDLWRKVEAVCKADAILSTCTSGIPLSMITEGFSHQFRAHFLGTHFFNPPRYLHLLEVIPGAETDPGVVAFVRDCADRRLGKGVVLCKDTSNFIANRVAASLAPPFRNSPWKATSPSRKRTR